MFASVARSSVSNPPHLAGGRSLSSDGLATNNPPHGRITSETVGVVYVLITTKATKHRLTELPRHAVPSVLAVRLSWKIVPATSVRPRASSSSR